MATLTPSTASLSGVVLPSTAAGVSGDKFAADGRNVLIVNNGSGSSINVTITSQAVAGPGLAKTDLVVAVANGVTKVIGPFPPGAFADSNGQVNVAYSSATSVTVGVLTVVPA